jgi:hypothetical protein
MSKALLEYKIIPRLMMLAFTLMAWNVCEWFMGLGLNGTPPATTQQAAFVSTIVGAATGCFGIFVNSESKK